MAKFDIVIPCYNYGRFLKACVESVLSQSQRDLRVLIIDDASSDDSARVAQQLAQEDARVTVNVHPQNLGHIATYNGGIEWACADYFLLLSADDFLAPGALERAAKVMDDNADIVLTYGACIDWNDAHPFPLIGPQPNTPTFSRIDLVRAICASATNFVPTPTAIGRTQIQKSIGGYRASLPHAGDLEMWLRYGTSGAVARINAVQGVYRKHATAMSNAYWSSALPEFRQRKLAFDSFFAECGSYRADIPALRQIVDRELAKKAFQSGIRGVRRGRLASGSRLFRWSMQLDPRLMWHPPLSPLFKVPGPDDRKRAVDAVLKAAARLVGKPATP